MIQTLTIRNIALIEHISVSFHPGLNVLSGETGAGKSIIVDAVMLILGGRADRDLIRTGYDKASVEAEFEYEGNPELDALLEREGISNEKPYLVLYREISRSGRNICRINGIVVPVSILKEAASLLLNLHGQSEHQFLADPSRHLSYLDLMGNEEHRKLMADVSADYQRFIVNHRSYAKLVKMNEDKELKTERILHELRELRQVSLHPGEEKELSEKARILHKSSRFQEKIQHISSLLEDGEENANALFCLQTASRELMSLGSEDDGFRQIAAQCETISYQLEDLLFRLNALKQRYEFDQSELESIENRLESVRSVLRRFGPSEDEVLRKQEELEEEYSAFSDLEKKLETTRADHKNLLAKYRSSARLLTSSRKSIAEHFEQALMHELKDLGMERTVFGIQFDERKDGKPVMPSSAGDDSVSFMISPNPGEPLKPLSSIASGGELSRLMLAVKTIESGRSGLQTMIFDEIDTGISGQMAQAVAEKMISISRRQQVICISHLPQIAAAADFNYLVFKTVREGRTFTAADELAPEQRIDEIARMISGADGISDDARHYAAQMIAASSEKKHGS